MLPSYLLSPVVGDRNCSGSGPPGRTLRTLDAVISPQKSRQRNSVNGIAWPCRYLDFETVATVLPLYDGHGCHKQVLTQFSIHHRNRINGEFRLNEYLADASEDC